ncbi:NRDE family protein [Thalassolituus sp. LLYu03]|uniref:NRDE family protein n=1 Tax=Thalassolituus sp. LLYu03 TaxID=3421656 RepID=UPI003D2DE230
MCLIAFDWQPGARIWLRLSANRDEFHQRPAAPLQRWDDVPTVIAGRDLSQGGTWLGVSDLGRIAALTNVRAPGAGPAEPVSRGHLATDWLNSEQTPQAFATQLLQRAHEFAPFNLLIGTTTELLHISNYPQPVITQVTPGIHGLSNAGLDTPWPKTCLATELLAATPLTDAPTGDASDALASLLSRRDTFADDQLPATGVPLEWERLLSAPFIVAQGYGTRCSTGLLAGQYSASVTEIRWDARGDESGRSQMAFDWR